MCGIAGIIELAGAPADARRAAFMAEAIAHRGPDGSGVVADGPVAFAHRRLAIIDLEGGHQPMTSSTGRTVVTYNGEVYNFRRLRAELAGLGYRFSTCGDTEVILAAYEAWGTGAFARLEGMFAFALWDARGRQAFLVRDPMGIKPLYLARTGQRVVFASEIKGVRRGLDRRPALDPASLNGFFLRQYVGGPATIYDSIERLPAGTCLRIDGARPAPAVVSTVRFSEPDRRPTTRPPMAEACDRLQESLERAVADQLVSDVPLGVFLSGGVDSSLLVALARRATAGRLRTFSVGFGDSRVDEVRFAAEVARRFGTEHTELVVDAEEGLRLVPELFRLMDQPLADYALLPLWAMSRRCRRHVKVVLAGEGADELFAGYPQRYLPFRALEKTRLPIAGDVFLGPRLFGEGARRRLLGDAFLPAAQLPFERAMRADLARESPRGRVNAALLTDLKHWLADDLLAKTDEAGMLASLEVRVPYLDPGVVRLVTGWDADLKLGFWQTKRVLKALAARHLPPAIVKRKKHGFTVPVGTWLRGPLRRSFEDAVFSGGPAEQWLQRPAVRRLWEAHQRGGRHGLRLWAVFVFASWLRHQDAEG